MEDLSYYNSEGTTLRKAQKRMLSILDVFVSICEKHKIDYWLYAGTALGARRHGGFIPWDDDLDVVILRKDYKKLVRILEEELPASLKLQTRKTDKKYQLFYAKIRDLNSVFYESGTEEYKYKGIFIDIFPLEQVSSLSLKKLTDSVLNSPYSFKKANVFYKKLKYILMMLLIPLANLIVVVNRWYFKTRETGIWEYTFGMRAYENLNLSHFFPIGKTTFEGKKYNVPGKIDAYLANHYGKNYMTIPPKEKRQIHAGKIEIF